MYATEEATVRIHCYFDAIKFSSLLTDSCLLLQHYRRNYPSIRLFTQETKPDFYRKRGIAYNRRTTRIS